MDDATRGRLLVGGQFAALGLWLWAGPWVAVGTVPKAVQAAGVAIGAWAGLWMLLRQGRMFAITPLPDAHDRLVTDGPYRWVRHPMYTALLSFVLPAAWSGPPLSIAAGVGLLSVLLVKSRFEDGLLARRFPGHADYRRRTGGLIPFVG